MRGRVVIVLLVAAFVAGCGDPDESDDSTTTTPTAAPLLCPDPTTHAAAPLDANELIGMTIEEAEDRAKLVGCTVRVTERDGEPLPATMDLRGDRIDVTVTDGRITAVALS